MFETIASLSPAARARERRDRLREWLPALNRPLERLRLLHVPAVATFAHPRAEGVLEHVAVAAVGARDELELDLLPAAAQLAAGLGVAVAAAAGEVVEERPEATLRVHEGAVAVERGRFEF